MLSPNRKDESMGVTLSSFSDKQFILLGHTADFLHLAYGNHRQDRIDAPRMNRGDADACFAVGFEGSAAGRPVKRSPTQKL